MAGCAAITANMCTKLGHESKVIQDINVNTFSHGDYYNNTLMVNNLPESVEAIIDKYDHIVYHDMLDCAVSLDSKHIESSYMFHGNMLRQQPKLYDRVSELESIDNIFVTTADLLQYAPDAEYFVRPVDMNLFKPLDIPRKPVPLCLTQERYIQTIKDCVPLVSEQGVFIIDRVKNTIKYEDMPKVLSSFTGYIDFKYQPTHPPTQIQEMSQTGLQALACGIPVLTYDGWVNTLQPSHFDENTCKEFIRVILT